MNMAQIMLAALLALAAGEAAGDQRSAGPVQLGAFEAGLDGWRYYGGFEVPGAQGGAGTADAQRRQALRIKGDFSAGGYYVGAERDLSPAVHAQQLNMAVRSEGVRRLLLRFRDATGQVHQRYEAVEPDGRWHAFSLDDFSGNKGHWAGLNDGTFHGPVGWLFVGFTRDDIVEGKQATIWIDDVSLKPAQASRDGVARATFGRDSTFSGIYPSTAIPTRKLAVRTAGRDAWKTDKSAGFVRLPLQVDDTVAFGPSTGVVRITFFDVGTGPFLVEHLDAAGGIVRHKVERRNTGTWRTASVPLSDALLANGIDGHDLRLSTYVPGESFVTDLTFAEVTFSPEGR